MKEVLVPFETLKGKVFKEIKVVYKDTIDEGLLFISSCGKQYKQYHDQQCCENVYIEDICGDLSDLIDVPILIADEVINYEEDVPPTDLNQDSYTWTFYKIDTAKGGVTIRWLGTSNGCYSETVSLYEIIN